MKSVVGFCGRAMPNENEVRAPKNRWKVIPVRGSVKADVVWALDGRTEERRMRMLAVALQKGFDRTTMMVNVRCVLM